MLSAGTSDGFCCSLTALFHKEQKKKKVRVRSNFSTTVSYVIYVFILAQLQVLDWETWSRREKSVVRVAAL